MHWAAYLEDADTTALLIRAGAKVDTPNNYGMTPLALAAGNGNAAIIDQLLKAGADPNGAVRAGETPLMLAARTGRSDAVKALLNAGANDRREGNLERTDGADVGGGRGARAGRAGADRAAAPTSTRAPTLARRRSCLRCGDGDMPACARCWRRERTSRTARPDGATPLLVAVINGHADLVDLLLDKGADPNVEGGSTELTVQGVRARPMELKYRKLTNNERDSEGVTRGNIFGRPLHAAVHVANWHISDQFIAVQHRSGARHQLAAGARRGRQRPNQHGGAQVVGRELSPAPGRRHRVSSGGQIGRRRGDAPAARPRRRPRRSTPKNASRR